MNRLYLLLIFEVYFFGIVLVSALLMSILSAESLFEIVEFSLSIGVSLALGSLVGRLTLGNALRFKLSMVGFSGIASSLPKHYRILFYALQTPFLCFVIACIVVWAEDQTIEDMLFVSPGIAFGWACAFMFRRRLKILV